MLRCGIKRHVSIAHFAAFAHSLVPLCGANKARTVQTVTLCTIASYALQRPTQIASAACMYACLPQPRYVRLAAYAYATQVGAQVAQATAAGHPCRLVLQAELRPGRVRRLQMAKTAAHSTASVLSAQSPTRPSLQNETAASASGAGHSAPSGAVLSPGTVSHRAGPYVCTASLRWLRRNLRVSQPQTPPRHPRRCCCLVPTSHQVRAGQSWCRCDCSPVVAPGEVVGQSWFRCVRQSVSLTE